MSLKVLWDFGVKIENESKVNCVGADRVIEISKASRAEYLLSYLACVICLNVNGADCDWCSGDAKTCWDCPNTLAPCLFQRLCRRTVRRHRRWNREGANVLGQVWWDTDGGTV